MHFDAFIIPFIIFVIFGLGMPLLIAGTADKSSLAGKNATLPEATLFDTLGGAAAIDAAVDVFYRRVLADSYVKRFFEGVDMDKQASKQKSFLTLAFGGPHNYTGKDMRAGHKHLVKMGLNDSHFDHILVHLRSTLAELGVTDEGLIGQVIAIAESTRNDVLDK